MKKVLWSSAFVAAVLAVSLVVTEAAAQQPPAAGPVAILDLTYIFKNHTRFKSMTEAMRAEVEGAENDLKAERVGLENMAKRLDAYRKGTPEYKQLEEEFAKKQADIQLRIQIRKKEFLEQESKIYYNVYQDVLAATVNYCKRVGIGLVLRFNGDPIDRNNPEEVLKEINKSVLYYEPRLDITPIILDAVNQQNFPTQPAPRSSPSPNVLLPKNGPK